MPTPCPAHQRSTGTGDGPLGGGGAHGSVGKRGAELPLGGAEVAGGHGQQAVCHSGAAQAGPNTQRLGHGAAGPEQPRKGQAQRPGRIARSRALGLQVSGQQEAHVLFGGVGFFQAEPRRLQLQLRFSGLPAGLPEAVVAVQFIELCRQRAFALLFAADAGVCGDDRRFWEDQGITPAGRHEKIPLSGLFFFGICAIIALVRYSAPSALPENCNFCIPAGVL